MNFFYIQISVLCWSSAVLFCVYSQYQWILAEPLQDPASVSHRKKKSKTILNNFGRKMTVKVYSHCMSGCLLSPIWCYLCVLLELSN